MNQVCLASTAAIAFACSPIQTVTYSVHEPDGRTITVDKYFSSVTTDDPGDTAFKQIKAAHVEEALATLRAAVASSPGDSGYHYDLAITYEIKADWPAALTEIREARKLQPSARMYVDEEEFIARHAGK